MANSSPTKATFVDRIPDAKSKLLVNAEAVYEQFLGPPATRNPNEWRWRRDESFRVKWNGDARGKWKCFKDQQWGDIFEFLQIQLKMDLGGVLDWVEERYGTLKGRSIADAATRPAVRPLPRHTPASADAEKRVGTAKWILRNTPDQQIGFADEYLRGRGITNGATLPYRSLMLTRQEQIAARLITPDEPAYPNLASIVIAATDARGDVSGVQSIYIHRLEDGSVGKARIVGDRQRQFDGSATKTIGNHVFDRASVKLGNPLAADRPTHGHLAIAEGFETGASFMEVTGIATWVTLGARLARVEIPRGVHTVWLVADYDNGTGLSAALVAAAVFQTQGLRVRILYPRPFAGVEKPDFNDVHRILGVDAAKRIARSAVLPLSSTADADERSAGDTSDARKRPVFVTSDPILGFTLWSLTSAAVLVAPRDSAQGQASGSGLRDLPTWIDSHELINGELDRVDPSEMTGNIILMPDLAVDDAFIRRSPYSKRYRRMAGELDFGLPGGASVSFAPATPALEVV